MSNRVSIDKTAAPQIEAGETDLQPEVGLHPVAVEIGIGAALWFVAMAWLDFARDGEIDYLLAIVTLFFVMFFTLFRLTASYSAHDPALAVARHELPRVLARHRSARRLAACADARC